MTATAPPLGPLSLMLRLLGPLAGAVTAAWALDYLCRRKGLMPPGFRHSGRRAAAFALVSFVFWVGIFRPLGDIGLELKLDLSAVSTPQLFVLHALMAAAVLGWFALGFAGLGRESRTGSAQDGLGGPVAGGAGPGPGGLGLGAGGPGRRELGPGGPGLDLGPGGPGLGAAPGAGPPSPEIPAPSFGRQLVAQLGLAAPNVSREVLIGLLLGVLAWAAVLLALAVTLAVWAVSGGRSLPKPSPIVPWIAALPVMVRVMVSLSAGFVEEIFFRGFLQPRVGIALSTVCFVLAHVSYGQPFMLLGVCLLSLIYAFLVRWRQTIWPAIAAHALFDGIQLLVIIPAAMRLMGQAAGAKSALRLVASACVGIW
jgi:membrane protease YdiL (CAAX protease family)